MPTNPMKGILGEMADQLRTRPLDLDEIRKRQQEIREARISLAEGEPGTPERFNAEG